MSPVAVLIRLQRSSREPLISLAYEIATVIQSPPIDFGGPNLLIFQLHVITDLPARTDVYFSGCN